MTDTSPDPNPIGFLRTTAIGGLLFLLPLIVLGALVGQVAAIVMSVAESLSGVITVRTPAGISLLIGLSIAIILLLCFIAGLIARRSFAKRLSVAFEKKIALLFPRYAILRDQMADTMGGHETQSMMKPVLVRLHDCSRIGFETERCPERNLVTVFLPGSPDPWSGQVAMFDFDRVEPIDAEFGIATTTHEQLGRGSAALITKKEKKAPS